MARVKRGVAAHKRHKRLLRAAEGRKGTRSRLAKPAREALLHAMAYSYVGRKQRKRQMRNLWIVRLNAAARLNGLTYGKLVSGLKVAGVGLDRKVLADIAVRDPQTFARIAEVAGAQEPRRQCAARRGLIPRPPPPSARSTAGVASPASPSPRTRAPRKRAIPRIWAGRVGCGSCWGASASCPRRTGPRSAHSP